MALPSWLQITPDLQLRALQAGTAAGSDIGRANQQRALAEIQAQQRAQDQAQQAAEFQQRILSDQVRNQMDQAFRRDQLGQQRLISDAELALRGQQGASSNAIRNAELMARNQEGDFTRRRYDAAQSELAGIEARAADWLKGGGKLTDLARQDIAVLKHPGVKSMIGIENQKRSDVSQLLDDEDSAIKDSKVLTREIANQFKAQANGDRALAEKLAREAGYSF